MTDRQKETFKRLWKYGLEIEALALRFGISRSQVFAVAAKLGCEKRQASGRKKGEMKG